MANPFVRVGGFFGRFFGNTIGESAAYGIGGALTEPIKPLLQELSNKTWATSTAANVGKPLDVFGASEVVAEDVEKRDWGVQQAGESGSTAEVFDAVLGATLNAPGIPQLFELWRRDKISDAAFEHGLRKAKLETRWDAPLKALKQRLLSLSDLANARQQQFIDVARQHGESALQGLDSERADILFDLAGLPPGPATMQSAVNRGLSDRSTFDQAIAEGHTKTKYTDLLFALRQPILSAAEYAELHLRNWITVAEMNAGGALSGYTPAQMQRLYENRGRPATVHQLLVGLRRGGEVGGPLTGIPQAIIDAVARSNIRPEYTNPLWHGANTYPSGFMIRGATQAGDITPEQAKQLLFESGWPEKWIDVFVGSWVGGTTATTDPHVSKAQTQLWGTLHRSYIAGESTKTAARPVLSSLGVTGTSQTAVLDLWDAERALVRKQLTPAQIKKAYVKGIKNQATGATWTRDDALAALLERGYSPADANEFLDL